MITVKLWGGLGNQLFQYAYGYQLAKKCNTQLILDISWFAAQNLRSPEILKLNIKYHSIIKANSENKLIAFMNNSFVNKLIRLPSFAKYKFGKTVYLKESRFHYSGKIDNFCEDNAYIDGYWQCPRYFDHVRNELVRMFFPCELRSEIIAEGNRLKACNSVAVHVRRGDYPKNKLWYSRLSIVGNSYYQEAIKYMEENNPNCGYYVFSDDIENAKAMLFNIIGSDIKTLSLEGLTTLEEWYLMSCCSHQIIGNSTFSWWSSYVNQNQDKIVCIPDGNMGNDDIIPQDWIRFHCNSHDPK